MVLATLTLTLTLTLAMVPAVSVATPTKPTGAVALRDLPQRMQKRLTHTPEVFLRQMAELIIGHGQGGAIGPKGIGEFIGLKRARVRGYHLRRLLQTDMDGDGSIAQAELAVLQRSVSARQRGILELAFRRVDIDQDAAVGPAELQAHAQRRALEELPPEEAALYRAVIGFDLDGSGGVTLEEVIAALAALSALANPTSGDTAARPPRKDQAI